MNHIIHILVVLVVVICHHQNVKKQQIILIVVYNSRKDSQLGDRTESPIFQIRALNNWIKSVLISMFCKDQASVFDFGGGKGGDLTKWSKQHISSLVLCDQAIQSINDCKDRYNKSLDDNYLSFWIKLIACNAFTENIPKLLEKDIYFDLVSAQFCIHYAFGSEKHVRGMLNNVTTRLKEGGYFIGTIPDSNVLVKKWRENKKTNKNKNNQDFNPHKFGNKNYSVEFKCINNDMLQDKKLTPYDPFGIQYYFKLSNNVDCPEYLLNFNQFVNIAGEQKYNLKLVLDLNFHEFFFKYYKYPNYYDLLKHLKVYDPSNSQQFKIKADQWEIAYLYKVFVFQKLSKNKNKIKKYPKQKKRFPTNIYPQDIITRV